MKNAALRAPSRDYADATLASIQKKFDTLVAEGAGAKTLEKVLVDAYTAKNRAIRNLDWQALNPRTIEKDYLLPRKEISYFVLDNWVRHLFLPDLRASVTGQLFMFGLGRVFSSYNDIGVQRNSDADVNLVVDDALSRADFSYLARKLDGFAGTMMDLFAISIEINPEFTLLRQSEVIANLQHPDPVKRRKHQLFYKSNAKSIHVFKDHAAIRKAIFTPIQGLPDSQLFEHFLGLGSAKPSLMKLRMDVEPLPIVVDGSGERVIVRNVIGSQAFARYCRTALPRTLFIAPPDWVFSMKYFVNRVYDYVCAMRNAGYDMPDIGFEAPKNGEADPDFLFVRNAHKLMLYLQELSEISTGSFGTAGDFTYMSKRRLLRFMELEGDKFILDFENMVISGKLLLATNQEKYLALKTKIVAKARDRFIEGPTADFDRLPKGFDYELIHKDDRNFKICVPYSWGDLGFFAFGVVASRISQIVETRLVPALSRLDAKGVRK
jgi:hypothetical protein